MNRRRALWGIALFTGSGLVLGGSTWFARYKTPDLEYLSAHKPLLAALAETILPATDTPGAIDAGVPDFILKSLLENAAPMTQNRFIDGMKAVDARSTDQYNKRYTECSRMQQDAVMRTFEADALPRGGFLGKVENRVQQKVLGEPFFMLLKNYTCRGYYTSMVGATQGIAYSPVPGRFTGCVAITAGQKSWATK